MHVARGDLGQVLLGAVVVVVSALGVRILVPAEGEEESTVPAAARAVAYLCFGVCIAAVAFGLYTLL